MSGQRSERKGYVRRRYNHNLGGGDLVVEAMAAQVARTSKLSQPPPLGPAVSDHDADLEDPPAAAAAGGRDVQRTAGAQQLLGAFGAAERGRSLTTDDAGRAGREPRFDPDLRHLGFDGDGWPATQDQDGWSPESDGAAPQSPTTWIDGDLNNNNDSSMEPSDAYICYECSPSTLSGTATGEPRSGTSTVSARCIISLPACRLLSYIFWI